MEAAAHQAQWKTQPDASPFLSRVVIYVGSRRQRGQDGVQILPDAWKEKVQGSNPALHGFART